MKIYKGYRGNNGATVIITRDGVECGKLRERWDLRNHSPDGFEWGYGGSGPAQLALALCADVLRDDEAAMEIYQDFKFKVIAGLDRDRFTLSEGAVMAAIKSIQEER